MKSNVHVILMTKAGKPSARSNSAACTELSPVQIPGTETDNNSRRQRQGAQGIRRISHKAEVGNNDWVLDRCMRRRYWHHRTAVTPTSWAAT